MANIAALLNTIKTAVYGRDMRTALHDAIKAVNDDVNTKASYLAGNGIDITNDTISVDDLGISTGMIGNLAVTNGKIANNAVSTSKIEDGAVTSDKIDDGAVAWGNLTSELQSIIEAGGATYNLTYENRQEGNTWRGDILIWSIATNESERVIQIPLQGVGNLLSLNTTEKGSIVGAINENKSSIGTINGELDTIGRDLAPFIPVPQTFLNTLPLISSYENVSGFYDFGTPTGNTLWVKIDTLSDNATSTYLPTTDEYGFNLSAQIYTGRYYMFAITKYPTGGAEPENGEITVQEMYSTPLPQRVTKLENAVGAADAVLEQLLTTGV